MRSQAFSAGLVSPFETEFARMCGGLDVDALSGSERVREPVGAVIRGMYQRGRSRLWLVMPHLGNVHAAVTLGSGNRRREAHPPHNRRRTDQARKHGRFAAMFAWARRRRARANRGTPLARPATVDMLPTFACAATRRPVLQIAIPDTLGWMSIADPGLRHLDIDSRCDDMPQPTDDDNL